MFPSLVIISSERVTIDEFAVQLRPTGADKSNAQAVRVTSSSSVTLRNGRIRGSLATNGIPAISPANTKRPGDMILGLPFGRGVNVYDSADVRLQSLDISVFHKGITFAATPGLTIAGCTIHDGRGSPMTGDAADGMNLVGTTYSFTPWRFGGAGDHGDHLHLFVRDKPVQRLVIQNNRSVQGAGSALVGIYLDDNLRRIGFVGARIEDNLILNDDGQGVRVEMMTGTIARNRVVGQSAGTKARILITAGSHDILVENNTTSYPISLYKLTSAEEASITVRGSVVVGQ